MPTPMLTVKQTEFMLEPFSRINLLDGSIRSGKTYVSLIKWAMWVRQRPQDELFMMVGKTRESLQFNALDLLEELTGGEFHASIKAPIGWLYGHKVRLLGANDEKATSKIKGSTLAGVYIDELTEIPQSFYNMCLGRLSVRGAIMLATTNPDSPRHYAYTDIVQNDEIDRQIWSFRLDDNTTLDADYVENIKREYSGVFYQRYILGEWVIAEGLVYPDYNGTVKTEPRNYTEYAVSMDYGTLNPTAAILWGKAGRVWYAVREYYYSGRDTNRPRTDQQHYDALEALCADVQVPYGDKILLIVDPSAASFIALAASRHRFKVLHADNAVIDGIRHTQTALEAGLIKFNDVCVNTIDEFGLYSWNPDSAEDAVIKENDHCLTGDTLVHTLFGKKKIKDLVGRCGLVWAYDERRKKKVLRPFHKVRKTANNQPILKITLEDGRSVNCTKEHPILTERGWVQAQHLKITDKVIALSD